MSAPRHLPLARIFIDDFRQNHCPSTHSRPGGAFRLAGWLRSNTFGNHGDNLWSRQTLAKTHHFSPDRSMTPSRRQCTRPLSHGASVQFSQLTGCPNIFAQILLHILFGFVLLHNEHQEPPISVEGSTMSTRVCPSISKYLSRTRATHFNARAVSGSYFGWWSCVFKRAPGNYLELVWSGRCMLGMISILNIGCHLSGIAFRMSGIIYFTVEQQSEDLRYSSWELSSVIPIHMYIVGMWE